ncbi:MAG TPA: ABC transporter permease [bacterium]|nr:ABC transporter permease [bacterium]
MATSIPVSASVSRAGERAFRHPLAVLGRLARNRAAVAGFVVLAVMGLAAVFAGALVPYGAETADFNAVLQPPSPAHPFGTDQLGRDILARIVYGGRISLLIGVLAVGVGAAIGVPLGVASGFYRGRTDALIQRGFDIMLSFPGVLLALTLISLLGVGPRNVILSVGIASVPVYVRLVRGVTLSVRELAYVESARAIGLSDARIMLRHVLPNTAAPIIVQSSLQLGVALLTAAGLGFLGIGVTPPTPEWGTMLGEAQTYVLTAWYMGTFPGLAIFAAVMAFNLFGDGLRDALDPRMKTL